MTRNQRGITLIELLAALGILSFVGIVIWSIFFQGLHFSQKESTKNIMQQDANIVIANLTKIHQTASQYEIKNTDCKISIDYTTDEGEHKTQYFEEKGMCFSTDYTGVVKPAEQNNINVTIEVFDKDEPKNKVKVDTTLYRLK